MKTYGCWFCGESIVGMTAHAVHVSTCTAERSTVSREIHCPACASAIDLRVSSVCATCGLDSVKVYGNVDEVDAAADVHASGTRDCGRSTYSGGTEMPSTKTKKQTPSTTVVEQKIAAALAAPKATDRTRTCPGCGSTYGYKGKYTNSPEREFCFAKECTQRENDRQLSGAAEVVAEAIAETKAATKRATKAAAKVKPSAIEATGKMIAEALDGKTVEVEQADGVVFGPDGADGAKRLIAAQEECAALKAWEKAGSTGVRPFTGNLDLVRAKHANGGIETAASKRKSGTGEGRKSPLGPRGQEGSAARKVKGDKRGQGRKLTDAELDAYLRGVIAEHPETTGLDELWYAHWVAGIACGKERMLRAFEIASQPKVDVAA